jgi:5'-3' exonuclease
MTSTLYLIDGTAFAFRSFFAIRNLTSPSGRPTNAVYGLTQTFLKLLLDRRPTHVAAAFDNTLEPTYRDALFPDYKATRAASDDSLTLQIPYCLRATEALGIRVLFEVGVEADDVLATLATRFAPEGFDVYLVGSDKDLAQLVGPHVTLYDLAQGRELGEAGVVEKFGVRADQIVDLLALQGDSVDNIPGIPGIGAKTAQILLASGHSVEELAARPDLLEALPLRGKASLQQKLVEGLESYRLSHQLATLQRDVPLALTAADLLYRGHDPAAVAALCDELGFHGLRQRIAALPSQYAFAKTTRPADGSPQ